MISRIHISCPSQYENAQLSRVWMIPNELKEHVVKLLGGNPCQPNSIPICPGYLTQSLVKIPSQQLLKCLGRQYIEIPTGTTIHYMNSILVGRFAFMMEIIGEAWKFTKLVDVILAGYTHEKTHLQHMIYSIGKWREEAARRHDGGQRYLLKYNSLQDWHNDLGEIYRQTVCFPEDFQKRCKKLDDLYASIF